MPLSKKWLVLYLLCVTSPAYGNGGNTLWDKFLETPDNSSYQQLLLVLKGCTSSDCRDISPSSEQLDALLILDSKLNPFAVDLTILVLPSLDGGDYEDAAAGLGSTADVKPELIFAATIKHNLPDRNLEDILCLLSPDLTDKPTGAVNSIQSRIRSVTAIKEAGVAVIQEKALKMLNKCLAEYRKEAAPSE